MAVLSDADRATVWGDLMRLSSVGVLALTKADLRAAVNAADTWVSDNAAAYNTALPQPARGALTAPQKALLLQVVVERRYAAGV